jgi:predicted nucleic acid binding AN1-type Zn finger protein
MNKQESNPTSKKRCSFPGCKKKLTLLNNYSCRCCLSFCMKHQLPESHDCNYNYKNDKIKLDKIVAPKIVNKI